MKKLQYIIYAILLLIIIGLVAYDYYPDQALDQNTITRATLLFIGTLLSIVKTATRSNREVSNKKATYSKAYPEFIGNAFSHSPKLEKIFYNAIDDYNQDRSASGIKKLEKLRPQCHNTDDIYAANIFSQFIASPLTLFMWSNLSFLPALWLLASRACLESSFPQDYETTDLHFI